MLQKQHDATYCRVFKTEKLAMQNKCKICNSKEIKTYHHTARCSQCGVLLYYPYPTDADLLPKENTNTLEAYKKWYNDSSFLNHVNFTNMLKFTMDESCKNRELKILDYGGGGGQFALICKSHFPQSKVYITDIIDQALLPEWSNYNIQIPFHDFAADNTKFDFIFLNDVFEHVNDPITVLKQLSNKLNDDGRVFIDTPKQFWLYPFTRFFSKSIYLKLLRGTVSKSHLQIWSKKSFNYAVFQSSLKVANYNELSEYTMPPNYYLDNMKISNPIVRLAGRLFYKNSKLLAKNKIMAVLTQKKAQNPNSEPHSIQH